MLKSIKMFKDGFESSSYITKEFKSFYNTFKKEFTKELESIEANQIEFSIGHFYLSGFYTIKDQCYFFSISDVRHFRSLQLLYRTAKNYKDYTRGSNMYVDIAQGMSKNMRVY